MHVVTEGSHVHCHLHLDRTLKFASCFVYFIIGDIGNMRVATPELQTIGYFML